MTQGKLSVTGVSRGRADHQLHLRNCLFLFMYKCIPPQQDHLGPRQPKGWGVGTVLSRGSASGQSLKEGRDLEHANTLPTRSLFWRGILSRSNPCHSVILSIVNVS